MPEIKNLKKAAQRILKAIKNKEKIILYGDADLDGVSSVIILKESIRNLGGKITSIYFPEREKEGYGLTYTALERLKNLAPVLLVVLDCGIGNFKEINSAKKYGFEVVIIDHHEILEKLPKASLIVNPKQKGDKYPFRLFAATGIIYKLSQELFGDKMPESLNNSFLELTALATLADMMPLENENKQFVEGGLALLEKSFRPGIQVFFKNPEFRGYRNLKEKVSKIIALLNVRDTKDGLPASFRLLTVSQPKEAEEMVSNLIEKNLQRRRKIETVVSEVEEVISGKLNDLIIFEGSENWDLVYLSTVASILSQKYNKPTFLFKKNSAESQGTVRLPKNLDGVKAMMGCKDFLLSYGGHPAAGGFKAKNEDLDKFQACLLNYFSTKSEKHTNAQNR